ncbi:MAG: DnaJ C-terminal domain-containing protein, partial [Candidatus Omnitrophota bacterium]
DIFSGSGRSGGTRTFYYSTGGGLRGDREYAASEVDTDITAELPIPVKLAEKGGEAKFRLSSGKNITLKIPPGTKQGQKMRLRGQGNECPCCRHKGDLVVTIKIK